MNWSGGLVDRHGAPLLGAHGAAMVVLVVRHGGHQLAPWASLSTGPCRPGASSDRVSSSLLAVRLKEKHVQEVTSLHLPHLPHSVAVVQTGYWAPTFLTCEIIP